MWGLAGCFIGLSCGIGFVIPFKQPKNIKIQILTAIIDIIFSILAFILMNSNI